MNARSPNIIADSLSATLFKSGRPLALVVGPDTHVYETDSQILNENGMACSEFSTIYDEWVDHLLPGRDPPAHNEYDLFLASELWQKKHNPGSLDLTNLYDIQRDFIGRFRHARFPLLDHVATLPFTYYVNFGFDPFLFESVKKYRPRARFFSVQIDDLESRWRRQDRATVGEPWVINLLGRSDQESITIYSDLADLFTEILQKEFLHDQMRSDLKKGGILFLGMQLRYWYTRVLLLVLRSEIKREQRRRRAFELRSPEQSVEKDCMLMYSESTSGISTELHGYREILRVLELLQNHHKITSVFISYRHEEFERMEPIKEYLEKNGIIVITSNEFQRQTGEQWRQIRSDAVRNSDCFIPLVTKSVANDRSSDCWDELDIALECYKGTNRMFPVVFDGSSLDKVWGDKEYAPDIQSVSGDAANLGDILLERVKSCCVPKYKHDG